MTQPQAPATDPLRLFLSGKRRYTRVVVDLQVQLHHAETRLRGTALDLSRGGVLVAVSPDEMAEVGGDPEEILAALVGSFCEGFDVRFVETTVRARAEMVRLSLPTGGADGDYFLGCRFKQPLSGRNQQRLGIQGADAGAESSTD